MQDSVDPHWQKEISPALTPSLNEASLHHIAGAAGLLALAVCTQLFLSDGPSRHDVPVPAHEAQEARPGDIADGLTERDLVCVSDGMRLPAHLRQGNHQFRESLVVHIAGNYKVSGAQAHEIVDAIFAVSRENNMDPLLVLGMIAHESSFNNKATSDYGAAGLMQVHAPSHQALLKEIGLRDRDPKVVQKKLTSKVRLNVTAGVRIYKAYEKQYGSAVKALQAYNGARNDPSRRYAKNVLAMRADFKKMALQHGACG